MKHLCVNRDWNGEILRVLACFQSHSGTRITLLSTIVHQRIKYVQSTCKYSSLKLLNFSPKFSLTLPKTEGFSFTLYSSIDLLRHCYGLWIFWTYILDIVHVMNSPLAELPIYFTYMAAKENYSSRI